jgi:hypothetical protein
MSLAEVDSIYLSVPVNFIFIGFDGKGGHGKPTNYPYAILMSFSISYLFIRSTNNIFTLFRV